MFSCGYSGVFLLVLCVSRVALVSSLGGAREMTDLHDTLFDNYSESVRPSLNYSHPTRVNVTLYVATIVGLDIKNQILKLSGYLSFEWKDELLLWNPARYGDIDNILVPQDWIWRPDVAVYNSVEERVYVGEDGSLASVSHDGLVRWEPVINLGVTCKVDISKYPFDENICTINVTAWMSDNDTVQLSFSDTPIRLDTMMTNGEYIVSPHSPDPRFLNYNGKYYTILGFRLLLKRRPEYLSMTLMVPFTMLSLMCVVPFFLSPDEPEKLMVSITLLLSFTVMIDYVSKKLPQTSEKFSMLVMYMTSLFIQSFLGVACNAFVLIVNNLDTKRQTSSEAKNTIPVTTVTTLQETEETSCRRSWDRWIRTCFLFPNHKYAIETLNPSRDKKQMEMSRARRLNNYFLVLNILVLVVITSLNWYFMLF